MRKLWLRICSLLLVVVMTANLLPLSIFAEEYHSSNTTATATEAAETAQPAAASNAKVVEEIVEGRTEFSKEFLLDSGLSLAVVYDSAVHYEKDGQWEEIDNTLKARTDGTITNTAGVWEVAFPQQLSGSNAVSVTKDGYTLSFQMAGELRQQENLEIMSSGDAQAELSAETPPVEPVSEPDETVIVQETNAPEETLPTETVSEDTAAETVPIQPEPEATIPAEPVIQETQPEEVVAEMGIEETVTTENMATVTVNGIAQTFAVSSANLAQGQIQTVDKKELLAEAEHMETVLDKPVSQLRYADVYPGTDIQYDLAGNQVKESIILESYSSTLRGYQYTLNTGGLTPVLNEGGSIHFYDSSKENVVMVMPAPYLVDNNSVFNYDIQVQLTGKGDTYTLTYILPQQWLAEEERAWPVVLDPVVSASLSIYNILDKTVGSKKSYDYEYGINEVGVGQTNGIQRFYVMYKNLPALTASDVIVSASVRLYKPNNSDGSGVVEVHKVNSTWKSETMTWSNKPAHNSKVEDFLVTKAKGYYRWEITDIVRGWYSGENTGMMFKVPNSTEAKTGSSWRQFYSVDFGTNAYKPTLYVYFRNNNGLESYWDYTSSSAGRAGTGYVNQYTGNLVWVHEDLGFGGNRMPVSINHVYNANDNAITRFGTGVGWRTNFNQRVFVWSKNENYYVWEDADGTDHYFLYDSANTYKDEDGLELTLTTGGSGTSTYKITDKNGNISYFDAKGRLCKQTNNQATKSSITVTYTTTSGYLISTVTDGAGRVYKFTYTDDLLTKIAYLGSGTTELSSVSYTYTDSKLTKITYKDGKSATFSYAANNLLSSATDIDGYTLNYAYNTTTSGQPNRISKISEFDGSVAGGVLNFQYAHNQTTLTDHNGNVQVLQFNNLGNTVCVQDGEGHAQYYQYTKNESGDSGKGNQLTASSKLQNTVGNRLSDSSFENSTAWTGGTVVTDTAYLGSHALRVTGATRAQPTSAFTAESGASYTFSAYVKTSGTKAAIALYGGETELARQPVSGASAWTRVEVSYTNTTSSAKSLKPALVCGSGETVYMDCVQVEKSPTASRYNLIQNGDFTVTGTPAESWTGTNLPTSSGLVTTEDGAAPQLDNTVFKLSGAPKTERKLTQQVPVSGKKGDSYILSGWGKGDSVPLPGFDTQDRQFGLRLTFNYTDDTTKQMVAQFNPYTNSTANWQYTAAAAVAEKDYSSITVEVLYSFNYNTAYFDGIQLYKEEFSSSYTYDEDNNVVSVVDLQQQKTQYEYENNNLTKEILPNGSEMTYTYDGYHNVKTATTDTGVVYSFDYDAYGNNTKVSITKDGVTISSSAAYSSDGNRLVSATDATGKTTTYQYNANTNVLEWVKYPEDTDATKTTYSYDNMYRMATAAAATDTGLNLSAGYTYADDLLTKIQTPTTAYNFTYGDFALRSNIKIGSRTLASYTYTAQDNYLSSLDYGNGDKVQYTYDDLGRVTKQTYEDGATVTYRYNNDGALATLTDSATGRTTTYYYDFIDRMMKYVESGDGYTHTVGYEYDTINNLTKLVETINGTEYETSYTYDADNRVTKVDTGNANKNYTYDGFGRVSQQVTKHGTTNVKTDAFTFKAPSGTATSSQVTGHTIDASGYDTAFTYEYDDNGNITVIKENDIEVASYVYDTANQLIRENNQAGNFTYTWTYDNAGNILNRKEYAYTTGELGTPTDTVNYAYGDASWGDLLTAYNGQTITHDEIGNPLNDGTWDYTWKHGRQLASMSDGTTTWNFTYNADGLRTKRTNGTTTYNYVYNGDKLSQMTVGSNLLQFSYDAAGTPMAVLYNGTTYYYATNLQGDVIAILDASGTAVVEYTYDAWGNLLATTGSMASTLGTTNPLHYRSYVYDAEYEFYYLQSRYYNPDIGRFLNADALASTGQGILGSNMITYCGNNPVLFIDPNGLCTRCYTCGLLHDCGDEWCISTEKGFKYRREIAVLKGETNMYYDTPVVRTPVEAVGFTFDVIYLGKIDEINQAAINLLRHEYGHIQQQKKIGRLGYTLFVVVPSVVAYWKDEADSLNMYYYDFPTEYIADQFSGVTRENRSPEAQEYAIYYWDFVTSICKPFA